MNIVENAKSPAKGGRVSYGIVIHVTNFPTNVLNEWGLSETKAREVNELLTLTGDKPFDSLGLTYSRRQPDDAAKEFAALKAQLLAAK